MEILFFALLHVSINFKPRVGCGRVKVCAGVAGSLNPQFSDIYLWLALDDVVDAGV